MQKQSGHCLCQKISFTFEAPPRFVAHCHCESCRRAHGAGFVTWLGIKKDELDLNDSLSTLKRYQSSKDTYRSFCSNCGSTLFYESEKFPGEVHIALAHLVSDLDLQPQAHVFLSEKAPWISIDDDLKKID